jgi:hypothetical protein
VERISEDDEVGELKVNEMTVNIQKQPLQPAKPLTKEKCQFILVHAMLNVTDLFKQIYLDLLLKHHEVISDNKYNLGKCSTAMHDIELKNEAPIYVKQFKIHKDQQEAVKQHVEELLKLGVKSNFCSCQGGQRSLDHSRFFCNQSTDHGGQILNERCAGMHQGIWASRMDIFFYQGVPGLQLHQLEAVLRRTKKHSLLKLPLSVGEWIITMFIYKENILHCTRTTSQ